MERIKGSGVPQGESPQDQLYYLLSSTLDGAGLGVSSDAGRKDSMLSPRAPLSTIDESCDTLSKCWMVLGSVG